MKCNPCFIVHGQVSLRVLCHLNFAAKYLTICHALITQVNQIDALETRVSSYPVSVLRRITGAVWIEGCWKPLAIVALGL